MLNSEKRKKLFSEYLKTQVSSTSQKHYKGYIKSLLKDYLNLNKTFYDVDNIRDIESYRVKLKGNAEFKADNKKWKSVLYASTTNYLKFIIKFNQCGTEKEFNDYLENNKYDIDLNKIDNSNIKHLLKKDNAVENKYITIEKKQYKRSKIIKDVVRQRAEGICEMCKKKAPFETEKGIPFLEVHHVISLSSGGTDTLNNTVALCPNCHRKLHYADEKLIKEDIDNINKLITKFLLEE